ncbi:NLR family CARD domain-containing protein 3 [Labeo rohita]|uniref:NLR family CARD domain-containing protein 3 n=1 Tax=Labeo rohita TaxID=84645 RepID=A0ABQ8LH03_LABRO|nr:NLR family CARD domain-containing protein 3 [Labeo rohita]
MEHAPICLQKHKLGIKEKFQRINEGISNQRSLKLLNEIYTELYITEGGSGEVNNQHEVRHIETTPWRPETPEAPIRCNDIFKALPGQDKPIRTVLTKGIAGIGKTVSVQKFILNWAEGQANQDFHFIFPLPFRELNLMKQKFLFIFDGLDECRLPLDFQNNDILCDVTHSASVDVLLTNLITGNLLPSALLWITSRPAAASQIPPEYVDQVTEVRGFNDPQKDEYFKKRINDKSLSSRIITHVKSSRSLYIMCHIPVFCWISANVLERMLNEAESAEIPKTLTQMFTHFLIYQIKLKTQKYDGKYEAGLHEAEKSIRSLGKLAFRQLEKGNLIFYEEDLRDCGIDVREASVYSGVCTQIFKEEFGLYLGKVYSFVHLSIQEFLAALFMFLIFVQNTETKSITDLLKGEVDVALQSENGHLDLYLRFLLGLSLESNQTLLRRLLTQAGYSSDSKHEIVEYIKMKIRENPSPEKSINLFHCLNELNDQSLVQEVQTYLNRAEQQLDEFKLRNYEPSEEGLLRLLPVIKASRKSDLQHCNLKERSCSALASVLSSNFSCLRDLDMSNNSLQDSGVKLLSVGLKNPQCKLQTLKLCNCSIREEGCSALVSALLSNPSCLRELTLNYNYPGDLGVKLLSDLLKGPECKLEKLVLYNCSIGEEGCTALVLALRSNPSHLRELNLNYNEPGVSGVKLLADLLKDPNCKLQNLELCGCSITEKGCEVLVSSLRSNPSHLRELNLSCNELGNLGVKLLSELLLNKLEKLQILAAAFWTSCSCLMVFLGKASEETITIIHPACDKGMNKFLQLGPPQLKNPICAPDREHEETRALHETVTDKGTEEAHGLECCSIEEEGCAALASALRSNLSNLRELNLSHNNPGDSGIKMLSDLLKDPHCKLEKLQVLQHSDSPMTTYKSDK